jgi:peptidoglycan-associated lipoprotein
MTIHKTAGWKTNLGMSLTVLFVFSGCIKKTVKPTKVEKPKEEQVMEKAEVDKPFDIESLLGQEWKEIPQLGNAHYEFDQAVLTSEARSVLQKNAKFLKDFPKIEVRVAGHCDDRGTLEYNIALGQRRARSARDYYKALGIPENRLSTISFGEERPLCTEGSEKCWAKNRRSETRVRVLSLEETKLIPKEKSGKTPKQRKMKG